MNRADLLPKILPAQVHSTYKQNTIQNSAKEHLPSQPLRRPSMSVGGYVMPKAPMLQGHSKIRVQLPPNIPYTTIIRGVPSWPSVGKKKGKK